MKVHFCWFVQNALPDIVDQIFSKTANVNISYLLSVCPYIYRIIYLLSGSPPKKVLGLGEGCIVHVIIIIMYCVAKSTDENAEVKCVHVS